MGVWWDYDIDGKVNLKRLAHFIIVDLNRNRKKDSDTKSVRLETLKVLLITGKICKDSSWGGGMDFIFQKLW